MGRKFFLFVLVVSIIHTHLFLFSNCLHIEERSLKGTEFKQNELTDKQLSQTRWLAYLTFLQTNITNTQTKFEWKGWEFNTNSPQLGLESIRYPLAFVGYTAGVLAYKTPAYRELSIKILDDCVQRMIQTLVWKYVEKYWKHQPTYPDPVAYENIMYSGHLAQLMALYESISGDMKYSIQGWDFNWDDGNTTFHYTAPKLMQVIYDQVMKDKTGGVSCEPNFVYVICQNHPHLGLKLYDKIHATNFSSITAKWQAYMQHNALETIPFYKHDRYFKLLYQRQIPIWIPVGTAGNDGWALAWMLPWNDDVKFVCNGWHVMYNNTRWRDSDKGGKYIESDIVGTVMELNTWLSTSFYSIIETQCGNMFPKRSQKFTGTFQWFESEFGTLQDTDNDGFKESYYYKTKQEEYKIWVTANILTSELIEPNTLRKIYSESFFETNLNHPHITNVHYPDVMVSEAYFNTTTKTLTFTILSETGNSIASTSLKIQNIYTDNFHIARNGKPFSHFSFDPNHHLVELTTHLDVQERVQFVVKLFSI